MPSLCLAWGRLCSVRGLQVWSSRGKAQGMAVPQFLWSLPQMSKHPYNCPGPSTLRVTFIS